MTTDTTDQLAAHNYTSGYIAGQNAALQQQLDDADQLAAIAKWRAAHPNAAPLPLVLKVCLLGALGCALVLALGGVYLGAWALAAAGAVLVVLVGLGAWKAGE